MSITELQGIEQKQRVLSRFVEMRSRWLTVIGENLEDDQGQILEYWRVEKADSVIILPIQGDRLLLPKPSYRPGVGNVTLDFPGGRVEDKNAIAEIARTILERELGILPQAVLSLVPINSEGWAVNSSFSNQKLYGYVAQIDAEYQLNRDRFGESYEISKEGIDQLLEVLVCLQCRAVLLDWWINHSK
jgi:hypothetical protein